ncbi:MAG: hypothetical protein ACXVBX_15255 [Flavisolibacter sp.]
MSTKCSHATTFLKVIATILVFFQAVVTISCNDGKIKKLTVDNFEEASLLGKHAAAVKRFLETNDRTIIVEFNGQYVRDTIGIKHELETDPNILYRLSFSSDHAAETIYRIHV